MPFKGPCWVLKLRIKGPLRAPGPVLGINAAPREADSAHGVHALGTGVSWEPWSELLLRGVLKDYMGVI